MITHDEFKSVVEDRNLVWGVRGFYRPVRVALGLPGLTLVCTLMGATLSLPILFAVDMIRTGHGWLAPWAAVAIVSWSTARPNFGIFDLLPWALCLGIGFALSRFWGSWQLVGPALVLGTFMLGAIIKYLTMGVMKFRLKLSAAAFVRLRDAGLLLFERT